MGNIPCPQCGGKTELKVWDYWGYRGSWTICHSCKNAWDEDGLDSKGKPPKKRKEK